MKCDVSLDREPVGPALIHRRRWLLWVGAGSLVMMALVVMSLVALALYYSSRVEREVFAIEADERRYNLVVESVGADVVVLRPSVARPSATWAKPGIFGLVWEGGYGRVGPIKESLPGAIAREFRAIEGSLVPGAPARIDSYAFPHDPARGLGIEYTEVAIVGELGPMPAWHVPASEREWAILVHGKGAERADMLRPLEIVHTAGMTGLVVSYRNDEEAPGARDGEYQYGMSEWQDLEAAARYARDNGADRLVLVGHSMGGAVILSFLLHSQLAGLVTGVVLDSPMLDLRRTVEWKARDLAPGMVIDYGLWASALRFGLEWSDFDYLRAADRYCAPMLVFHGQADASIPVSTSEALAAKRSDIVRLISLENVGHVQSWNADPMRYEAEVVGFLGDPPPAKC